MSKKRKNRIVDDVLKPKADEVKSSLCSTQFFVLALRTVPLALFYYVFSIGLTFYNQRFVKHFHYPLSLTVCHLVVKFVCASIIRLVLEWKHGEHRVMLPWGPYIKRIAPPGIASAVDIGLSNWSLEYITISLYTMCKSSVVIFILGFAILFKLEKCRISLVFIVMFIATGLFMFTYHTTDFSLFGFSIVMAASVLSGIRWTLTQIITQKDELGLGHPLDMIYHIQPWMLVGLLPLSVGFEGIPVSTTDQFFRYTDGNILMRNIGLVLFGAGLAFMLEFSEFLFVRYTSSLTLSICGIVKEIITLFLSVEINGDRMNTVNIIGLFVCMIGIILHVTNKAMNQRHESSEKAIHSDAIRMLSRDGSANISDDSEEDIFNVATDR